MKRPKAQRPRRRSGWRCVYEIEVPPNVPRSFGRTPLRLSPQEMRDLIGFLFLTIARAYPSPEVMLEDFGITT